MLIKMKQKFFFRADVVAFYCIQAYQRNNQIDEVCVLPYCDQAMW